MVTTLLCSSGLAAAWLWGRALPRVKAAANRETLSCDEDGVALVIEELVDGNGPYSGLMTLVC